MENLMESKRNCNCYDLHKCGNQELNVVEVPEPNDGGLGEQQRYQLIASHRVRVFSLHRRYKHYKNQQNINYRSLLSLEVAY